MVEFLTSASKFDIQLNGCIFDVSPENDRASPNVKSPLLGQICPNSAAYVELFDRRRMTGAVGTSPGLKQFETCVRPEGPIAQGDSSFLSRFHSNSQRSVCSIVAARNEAASSYNLPERTCLHKIPDLGMRQDSRHRWGRRAQLQFQRSFRKAPVGNIGDV